MENMMVLRSTRGLLERFGEVQVRTVGHVVEWARELTGEHFRLGSDEAHEVPYDVRTLSHLDDHEIHPEAVLADIARYEYLDPRFGRKRDLYRVNLQDHNILETLKRAPQELKLPPLLLYVLTHELIHVIRFVKFLAPFHSRLEDRQKEERRVHAVTRQLLARVPVDGMDSVLRRYEHMAVDVR